LAACWLLVGCLLAACSEVPVWEILNCDRTRSRGCTEDFYKKKICSNTFFSQCKLVDMVCPMKSHQGRFQQKSFSGILCAFSRDFFLVLPGKMRFWMVFLFFHCCSATCVAFRPPLFHRLFSAPIMYICWLPNQEIYIIGTAPCSTGRVYSTSTVRLLSWYCPTFFCRSIVFHFFVSLRYVRLMFPVLLT